MPPFGKQDAHDAFSGASLTPSSLAGSGAARAGDARPKEGGKPEGRPGVPLSWIERQRLKRTIPVDDHEIDDVPLVRDRLKRALKGEDERGRKQHWSYDQNRHMALMKFLRMYESWSAAA